MFELVEKLESGSYVIDIKGLWVKKNGKIYRNKCRPVIYDLDSLPFPDHDLYDYPWIVKSNSDRVDFLFSRGWPYNCTYCSNHALRNLQSGNYICIRSVDNLIPEIKQVVSKNMR